MSTRQQALQLVPTRPQDLDGLLDSPRRVRELLGVGHTDLLTTHDIVREYRFPSPEAVRQFLRRHPTPNRGRGRGLLIDRRDFEAALASSRVRVRRSA